MRLRRTLLTLRWRMVLLAAVLVAVILLVGGVVLSFGLRTILTGNALDAAKLRVRDIAVVAAEGGLPEAIPITGQDEALVQVVANGRVLAASVNIAGERPLRVAVPPSGVEVVRTVTQLPIGSGDRFALVSLGTETPAGAGVVHAAVSLSDIDETVMAAVRVGLLGLPVLVLLLSAAMWMLVGRTLRPIESIRREAEGIGGDQLTRRVPVPPARDEVGRLARTVNDMLARIEDSARRQRRFVGDAAHELRSPIASLRTQLETARGARATVDWHEVSTDLLNETLRMQRLTEQLLVLARLDATRLDQNRVAVDLDDLIVQAANDQRRQRPDQTVDLHAVEPVQLPGEPTLLGLVVRNLLDNAARHAVARVAVQLHDAGDAAVMTIDDDGPGIPQDRRDDLFERFVRLDDARDREHGGAGLGLAIVSDIVDAHGGTVVVERAPELGGARLIVVLPKLTCPQMPRGQCGRSGPSTRRRCR